MDRFVTLQDIVAALAERGGREALIAFQKDRTQTCSAEESARLSQRLARGLAEAGLEPGARVMLFAPNRAEWILAALGVISAAGVPVPIDVQIPREELRHILRQSGARWAFTTATLEQRLADGGQKLNVILLDAARDGGRSWHNYLTDSDRVLPSASPDDLAVLFYTSGTSGRPKGVPLTHKNLASNVNSLLALGLIRPHERVLVPLPLHHVYPLTVGMLAPLAAGVPIILPYALTGAELVRAIQQAEATAVIGVPRLYQAFLEGIESTMRKRGRLAAALFHGMLALSIAVHRRLGINIGRYLFAPVRRRIGPRLEVLASGGSAMDPDLAWKLQALGWQLASGYGLTETSPLLTFNEPGREKVGTAGRPIPGIDLRIGKPEKEGQPGEVQARGPSVFSGYWQMPEKNAEAFTEDGYFRTGDLGYFDEKGYLRLAGRGSSMIVLSGGENVQPDNIEAALERSPQIREAAVLQKGDRLAALIVPERHAQAGGQSPDNLMRAEVKRQMSDLPSHHRVSDFAVTDEPLPRTRIGKLRRHMLPERFERAKTGEEKKAAAGPVPVEQMSPEDQELLQNPAAKAIWDWLPGRFPDARIAPEMNLQLDLGIDSLDWLNLAMEVRALTGVELQEAAIGRIETVCDLLREVAAAGAEGVSEPGGDLLEKLKRPKDLLGPEQRRWLEARPRSVRILGSSLFAVNRALMRALFRLRIEGRHRLPDRRPFVIMPNHVSFLDPLAVGAALPKEDLKRTYWGGWTDMMFGNPVMRLLSRAVRVIPIDPKGGPLSSIAFAVAALQEGYNLIWFPEGGRSPDGRLKRFRPGIGLVARAHPVPIVPVWIEGAHEALPSNRRVPRLRRIAVTFGEPVNPAEIQPRAWEERDYQAIADALYERLAELASSARRADRPGRSGARKEPVGAGR